VFATRTPPVSPAQHQEWWAATVLKTKTHHARVGGYLLGLWGFPEAVVEAIVWHHTPSRCGDMGFGLCGLLHVGDYLSHMSQPQPESAAPQLEPGYLEDRGLAAKVPEWLKMRAQK
jgi:hypothetical protein